MANALLTPTVIAKEALMQVENSLVMGNIVHREFKDEFVSVGDTVSIRRPVQFEAKDGATLVVQDVEEGNTSIVINKRKHVGWQFTSQDLTLTIEDFSTRYIEPAAIQLANIIDADLNGLYTDVWNHVGTPGTDPATFLAVAAASQRLDDMAVPDDGRRKGVLYPQASYKVADSIRSTFIQGSNKTALEKGRVGDIATLEAFKSQNVKRHTVGVATGTPLVDGATQNVTYAASKATNSQSLVTDGWTSDTAGILLAGDVITLVGVNAVNPVGKEDLGFLQEFTVLADAAAGATTGPATLTISPPMITTGPYKTVTAAPADDAAIVVKTGTGGTAYPQNLAFHRNAFALVTVPLEMPDGVNFKARETHNGISIRLVKDYDIVNDVDKIRMDVLYGVKAINPRFAVRLTS